MNLGEVPLVGETHPHRVVFAEVPLSEIKGRLIRNPGYNNQHVSLNGWCWIPDAATTHRKPQFQEALRESIQQEGIRNPVIIYALKEGCFLSFGGSRLRAARDLDLDGIPAIVNDYVGRFATGEEVNGDNYSTFFTEVPRYYEFTQWGFDYHYALERKRRADYDKGGLEWAKDAAFIDEEFPWVNGSNTTSRTE